MGVEMGRRLATLVALVIAASASGAVAQAQFGAEPCADQLDGWVRMTQRPMARFPRPAGLDLLDHKAQREAAERAAQARRDQWAALQADAERQLVQAEADLERSERNAARAIASQRQYRAELARRPPPRLGMDTAAVLNASSWGRPSRITRVTNASGVSESWFYSGRGALVFVGGRLASIHEY